MKTTQTASAQGRAPVHIDIEATGGDPEQEDSPRDDSAAANTPPGDDQSLALGVEAILMSTDHPIPVSQVSEMLGGAGAKAVNAAIQELNELYERTGRSFRIQQIAKGWQILTLPQHAQLVEAAHKRRSSTRLSPAAMETLAIIAYKQPILRADIESVRGVACGEVLRGLMERHLVKIVGRAEELGRPMLYGTTKTFLELFGLASLKDLPKAEEFWGKS